MTHDYDDINDRMIMMTSDNNDRNDDKDEYCC